MLQMQTECSPPPRFRTPPPPRPLAPRGFHGVLAETATASRYLADEVRQLHFESEEYALDLRLQRTAAAAGTEVVGQLMGRLCEPVADAPAYLISGGEIVAFSFSGDLGDFHLQGRATGPLEVWLFVGSNRRIAVSLAA